MDIDGSITLSCFVSRYRIPNEHWYRNPKEGTRICGNLRHWRDLAVHILSWKDLPEKWRISIAYSSKTDPDDNISVSMTSARGDLPTFVLTSRLEPFDGIKDVGHLRALVQPFIESSRDWKEVELSTLPMLAIKGMVLAQTIERVFSFRTEGVLLEPAEVLVGA